MNDSSVISRYLITGCSGFIGSRLIKILKPFNGGIWGLDILPAPKDKPYTYDHIKLDISAEGAEARITEILIAHNIQLVIHLASLIKVGEGEKQPDRYKLVNIHGTEVILRAMEAAGVRKLIFASSAAVYQTPTIKTNVLSSESIISGEVTKIALKEDDILNPVSVYGETKLVAEQLIRKYVRSHQFEAVILRFFNVGGGKEIHQPPVHLIPIIIEKLIKGEPIQIFGKNYPTPDGTCYRDYFHVHDLIYAIILALQKWNRIMFIGDKIKEDDPHDSIGYEQGLKIYNLGQGQGYTVLQVFKKVSKHYSAKYGSSKDERLGSMIFVERRKGDPPILLANCTKAKRELGWKATKSLDSIIKDTLYEMTKPKKTKKNITVVHSNLRISYTPPVGQTRKSEKNEYELD